MGVYSTDELREQFVNKLVNYSILSEGGNEASGVLVADRINKILAAIDEPMLKKSLTEMMFIPIEIIAGDFLHSPPDRVIPKIKFANGPV